jgi:hypothetical protein
VALTGDQVNGDTAPDVQSVRFSSMELHMQSTNVTTGSVQDHRPPR